MKLDKPSTAEIESYYLSDTGLKPKRFEEVKKYVTDHYLDGGTREQFIAQRKRVEDEMRKIL